VRFIQLHQSRLFGMSPAILLGSVPGGLNGFILALLRLYKERLRLCFLVFGERPVTALADRVTDSLASLASPLGGRRGLGFQVHHPLIQSVDSRRYLLKLLFSRRGLLNLCPSPFQERLLVF